MKEFSGEPRVFYLCHAPETGQLVFPDELPDNYNSPGFMFIEENKDGGLSDEYAFLAAHGDKYVTLNLVRSDAPNKFRVDAGEFGHFTFQAVALDPALHYVGNRRDLFKGTRLWGIGPADQQEMERQEQVCLQHDFYFLGGFE